MIVIAYLFFLLLCEVPCVLFQATDEGGVHDAQCICKPAMRSEPDDKGSENGDNTDERIRPICNDATVSWLLNTAVERMTDQDERIKEMREETRRQDRELGVLYDLLALRDERLTEGRKETEHLQAAVAERDAIIAELDRKLDEVKRQVESLKTDGEVGSIKDEECSGTFEMENHKQSVNMNALPRDCSDLQEKGVQYSGVYTIYPEQTTDAVEVFCDLDTDEGRWTVIQRRLDGSETFERNWTEYRNGFGSPAKEFWLGNENIHRITNQRSFELRIDLTDFDSIDYWARYGLFSVSNEADGFRVKVGQYTGNAGDSFSSHDGSPFSTVDVDQDGSRSGNCAKLYGGGGWWFSRCYDANLNGRYEDDDIPQTIVWFRLPKTPLSSLRRSEMKIRPTP